MKRLVRPSLAIFALALAPAAQGIQYLEPGVLPEGDHPVDLEVTVDGRYALLLHQFTENVAWYDLDLREVVGALDVGPGMRDLELTPDGRLALVVSEELDALVVVDLGGRSVLGSIPVGDGPVMVRAAQDSRTVYVANNGDASVSKVDLGSFAVVGELNGVDFPKAWTQSSGLGKVYEHAGFELADGDAKLLALSSDPEGLQVIDTATMEEEQFVYVFDARTLSVTPDGRYAGLLQGSPLRYSLYATDTMFELAKVTVTGLGPTGKTTQLLDPAGEYVYLTRGEAGRRIRLSNGAKTAFNAVPDTWSLAIDATGRSLVVGGRGNLQEPNTIRIFERIDMKPVAELDTGVGPLLMAMSPVAPAAVAILKKNTPGVIEKDFAHFSTAPESAEVLALTSSGVGVEGDYPFGVGVSPDGTRALVCNAESYNLTLVDVQARVASGHIPLGYAPQSVEFAPNGEFALVRAREPDGRWVVLVVDLASREVDAVLPFELWVVGLAITPDSSTAVVLERRALTLDKDRVTFVHLDGPNTHAVTRFGADLLGSSALDTHVTPDGAWLFVGSFDHPDLAILDLVQMDQRVGVPLTDPWGIAPRPGGAEIAVTNGEDGIAILAVDGGATAPVGAAIPLEEARTNLAYSPDGAFLYAAGRVSGTDEWVLASIDAETHAIVDELPIGNSSYGDESLVVSADGTRIKLVVYETSAAPALWNVAADGGELALLETETLPTYPQGIAGSPSEDLLLFTSLERIGIFTGTQ